MYPTPTATPDSPDDKWLIPKTDILFVSWWNRSTAELFSCRKCIHFNSVYREDGRVYTVETEIKLLLRNQYDQILQSYYSICAFFVGITLWYTGSNGRLVYSKGGMGDVCWLLFSFGLLYAHSAYSFSSLSGWRLNIWNSQRQSTNQPAIQGIYYGGDNH